MPKPKRYASLSAAECARRTGLTVRALRVYERHGLIEPARSGKGWRLYGPKELRRLNVIITLKTFGMTLAQIRSLLKTRPPPLGRVLVMQLRACRARRDGAEKALQLVQTALATIQSGRPLALDELCNLTRSMEMANHHAIVRELINEQIAPHEERAYMTWVAARPPDEIKAMQEYGAAVHTVFRSLQDLRERKVEPAAPEAQALIIEWNALAVRYGLRQFMATLLEWNPAVARKWLQVGERALSLSTASQQAAPDDGLWAYFGAAQEASPWHQALTQMPMRPRRSRNAEWRRPRQLQRRLPIASRGFAQIIPLAILWSTPVGPARCSSAAPRTRMPAERAPGCTSQVLFKLTRQMPRSADERWRAIST